ncbi:MAG: hypothetical protein ACK4IY_00560, partial [Chitinophagales bacterium]
NYNAIRFIGWNFFGKRQLLWDKHESKVRVDLLNRHISIIASLHSDECIMFKNGVREYNADTLAVYLEKARLYWMNDAYWLVMPFKLFDQGAQLTYYGAGVTADMKQAEILELTFNNVGATPNNKYHIYIDKESRLISQWAYFQHADDKDPAIVNPWTDYEWYGKIRLASGRGDQGTISDIHVWDRLPSAVFENAVVPEFSLLE